MQQTIIRNIPHYDEQIKICNANLPHTPIVHGRQLKKGGLVKLQ